MNTLYDLVTKIDALTANSQQVLNALIRSCVASGSSSGYRVNKYGVTIELDRADIYHLYDFYQSWQAEGFPSDEESFNSLLAAADARWRTTADDTSTLASDAVAKHSKILYLNKDQGAKLTDENTREAYEAQWDNSYWADKIRESASPMGTISTAPIPLNLRTPLYDENLSTKSFSQFETYLFPIGYHRADILGTPGNGDDYIAGGRNWTIDATDYLTLGGNHILLGSNTNPANKTANYGDSNLTISWGNESYAFGNLSLAFGDHSIAKGNNSSVFGNYGLGLGDGSFVAGGKQDITVGSNSFATNWVNTAVGPNSFAANTLNYAGGWGYAFTFIADESNAVSTECEVTYDEASGLCVSNKKVSETVGASSLYKVIRVSAKQVEDARMPFDIKADDMVVIYDMWMKNDKGNTCYPNHVDGYAADPFVVQVTNVTAVMKTDNSGSPTTELDHYEITLSRSVPVENQFGLFNGGTVSVYSRAVPEHGLDGAATGNYTQLELGRSSSALGYGNASIGLNQLAVGQMGVPNIDAKFVVGTGSSYITGDADDEGQYRANSLVIGDTYSYMKLASGKSYIGLAAARTTVADKAPHTDKLTLARGTIMHSYDPDTRSSSSVTTDYDNAFLLATGAGEPVARIGAGSSLSPYFTSDYPTSVLQSLQGTAVIASGAYIEAGSEESVSLVDRLLGESHAIGSKDEHGVAIYAQDGIDIRNIANSSGRGINIETCSYLTMSFDTLRLQGMTFRSLPATDSSESFALNCDPSAAAGRLESVYWGHCTGASGFYFIGGRDGAHAHLAFPGNDSVATHSMKKYKDANIHLYNSEIYDAGGERYHVASLAIPEANYGGLLVNNDKELMRPCVTTGCIYGVGGNNKGNIVTKELPYMSDISMWSAAPVSNYGYRVNADGTMTNYIYSSYNYSSGDTGITVAMPVMELDLAGGGWTESNTYAAYCATIGGYQYHTAQIVVQDKSSSISLARVYVSASIVGNTMDITGYFVLHSTGSWTKDGLRVPLIPGFAVQSLSEKFGSAGDFIRFNDYMYKNNYGFLVSCLSGNHSTNGDSFLNASIWEETDDNRSKILSSGIRFGGVAVSAGIVTVDMYRISHLTDWVSASSATDRIVHPYGFHISGPVPFETVEECLGANINTGWTNAMARCYNGKIICPKTTLVNILGNN